MVLVESMHDMTKSGVDLMSFIIANIACSTLSKFDGFNGQLLGIIIIVMYAIFRYIPNLQKLFSFTHVLHTDLTFIHFYCTRMQSFLLKQTI